MMNLLSAVPVAIPIKATVDCLQNITLRDDTSNMLEQMLKFLDWQTGNDRKRFYSPFFVSCATH